MQSAHVLTHPALARQRFREIAARPDPEIDLVEASLVIALEDNPGLTIDRYLTQVNQWSDSVRERLMGSRDVERIVDSINRLLFDEEGFHGRVGDRSEEDKLLCISRSFYAEVTAVEVGLGRWYRDLPALRSLA